MNFIGRKFHSLTVIDLAEKDDWGAKRYKVKCDCGNTKNVHLRFLQNGQTKSCGCLQKQKIKEICIQRNILSRDQNVGKKFGRLTVINRSDKIEHSVYLYECECECGKRVFVSMSHLRYSTKSCGCLMKEMFEDRGNKQRSQFNYQQFINQKFNKLTIIKFVDYRQYLSPRFNCICECGNIKENVSLTHILRGNIRSCGCLQLKNTQSLNERELNQKERNKFYFSNMREKVFKRDKYTCFICKEKYGILEAHHIEPWSQNKDTRFDISNLITLCSECHLYSAHDGNFKRSINIEWKKKFMDYTFSFDLVEI